MKCKTELIFLSWKITKLWKQKHLSYLEGEKNLPNVISPLLSDKLCNHRGFFSLKLWKPAKRDQKLVSPAQFHFTKLKILSQKNQRKEVAYQHLSMVLGCRQLCRVNVPLGLNILRCIYSSFQRCIPVTQTHSTKIVLYSV